MVRRTSCLACEAESREPVLSLGSTPLANRFLTREQLAEEEPSYPLEWLFCERCGLVHLTELVDPEILFGHYLYMTGWSKTMRDHHEALVDAHVRARGLTAADLVVDVASNDGSLLLCFRERGVRTLGIEPARNLAQFAREQGIETLERFFGAEVAREVREAHGPAAVATANNVLAHVPEPRSFLEGMRLLTEPHGVVSVEVPWLVPLLEGLEYDTIYHEHLSYFSIRALAHLFERAGLAIFDLHHVAVHGGTVRVLARAGKEHGGKVLAAIADEKARGLEERGKYLEFAERVARNREALRAKLEELRKEGKRVAAYGAPAKGNTLLNYCEVGPELVSYTVDKNPLKVGRFTPGMHLEVKPHTFLAEDRPDHALILPWNLKDEIVAQESAYRAAGGRFLVPLPEPKVVS